MRTSHLCLMKQLQVGTSHSPASVEKLLFFPEAASSRGALSTSAEIPSLLMLSGMRWIFCSLTQELVNICSSTDVSEAVLTPEERTVQTNSQQEQLGWLRGAVLLHNTHTSSAAP